MAELKTQKTEASVEAFLAAIADDETRRDCQALAQMMADATGAPAAMWGSSIVGFGSYHYTYASGRAGDWFLLGFSPRKQNLTLYIMSGFEHYDALLTQLGKHKLGKACLYINKLADVDLPTLKEIMQRSVEHMIKTNPHCWDTIIAQAHCSENAWLRAIYADDTPIGFIMLHIGSDYDDEIKLVLKLKE